MTSQPRSVSTCLAGARTARTTGSTGRPRSALHATLTPRMSRVSRPMISAGSDSAGGGASRASGTRGSGPEMAASSRATSATVRPIGPSTPSQSATSVTGQEGTRPGDGRSPTTLQKLAGFRSEPPRSLPSASASIRAASAAAAPPLLPPELRPGSYGFLVAPNSGLTVCDPAPNSGVFVFPRLMAPAPDIRLTISASRSARAAALAARRARARRRPPPPWRAPG